MNRGEWLIEWMDAVKVEPHTCQTPCGTPEVPGCPCDQRMEEIRAILLSSEAEQREPTLADLERQLKQAEFEKQAYTDALRYRWLRDEIEWLPKFYNGWKGPKVGRFDFLWPSDEQNLDAAIDAAMSASGETEDGEGFDDSPTREER